MMITLNIKQLLEHLRAQNYDAQFQELTHQVYIVFTIDHREFPLFIKTDGEVLQLMIFMPCRVEQPVVPDLARVLHLINKELDLPGFGMDENQGLVFYRGFIPSSNGKIESDLLDQILHSMIKLAPTFFPLIAYAVSGTATFNKLVVRAKETLTKLRT
ncbi:MAG: YbjN domain-containing protein [Parachlamydiaceae bacterium]|nr:YbjN domain-containing protein [Parachlamydiaceae bacterium]